MQENDYIQYDIADMIMGKPLSFSIGDEDFYIYPVTLGKSYLMQRLVDSLKINKANLDIDPFLEVFRLCDSEYDTVLRIIAYSVLDDKKDLFDERKVCKLIDKFRENIDKCDLAKLLLYILSNDKFDICVKYLGIDSDRKEQSKILKIKSKGSNVLNFGGKSIYGSLIDAACERYGWTMDYVVWGISYFNLRMLMADMITSISLTDDEKKKARIRHNGSIISGDDPSNLERIKAMFPD